MERGASILFLVLLLIYGASSFNFNVIQKVNRARSSIYSLKSEHVFTESEPQIMSSTPSKWTYGISFLALPATLSYVIPFLLDRVTDFSSSSSMAILALLLVKRLGIYSTAFTVLNVASIRAVSVSPNLGQRISALNLEVLGVFGERYSALLNTSTSEVVKALDETEGSTQALALPLIVAGSLISSFLPIFVTQKLLTGAISPEGVSTNPLLVSAIPIITAALHYMSLVVTAAVCTLFCKVEIEAALRAFTGVGDNADNNADMTAVQVGTSSSRAATLLAVCLVGASFMSTAGGWGWPLQNLTNACVAIVVTRALQLPRLPWVLVSLCGLALYDVLAVSGTQALMDNGASIMEAVARTKAGLLDPSATSTPTTAASAVSASTAAFVHRQWLPGLLQIATDGRPSDLLGLGDVVFPAMLTGWALRWDAHQKEKEREDDEEVMSDDLGSSSKSSPSLFQASLFGFVIGCFLCEFYQTGAGQPALIYIIPAMSAAVLLRNPARLQEMWLESV